MVRSAGVLLLLLGESASWSALPSRRVSSRELRRPRKHSALEGGLGGDLAGDILAPAASVVQAAAAWAIGGLKPETALWSSFVSATTHPVVNAGLTAGLLSVVGDSIAQGSTLLQQRNLAREALGVQPDPSTGSVPNPPRWAFYDAERGLAFALFGFGYSGCFQYYWFAWLNANTPLLLPSTAPLVLGLFKTVVNQCCMAPVLYCPVFFALTGALAGLSPAESLSRAQDRYFPILLRGLAFWIPAQLVMFAFVPPPLQLTFLCSAGVYWTAILSALTGAKTPSSDETNLAGGGGDISGDGLGGAISNSPLLE